MPEEAEEPERREVPERKQKPEGEETTEETGMADQREEWEAVRAVT